AGPDVESLQPGFGLENDKPLRNSPATEQVGHQRFPFLQSSRRIKTNRTASPRLHDNQLIADDDWSLKRLQDPALIFVAGHRHLLTHPRHLPTSIQPQSDA